MTSNLFESSAALVEQAGAFAPALIALVFIFGALVAVPRPLLSVLSGFAFGWWGLPLAFVSAVIGAALAFYVGRRFLRPRLALRVRRSPLANAGLQAVDQEGFRAVLLLRLGPVIPSSVLTYLFSLTSIPFRPYLAGTCLGILPGVAAQVWTGAMGRAALQAELGPGALILWAFGMVSFVAATVLIGRRIRRVLIAQVGTEERTLGAVT